MIFTLVDTHKHLNLNIYCVIFIINNSSFLLFHQECIIGQMEVHMMGKLLKASGMGLAFSNVQMEANHMLGNGLMVKIIVFVFFFDILLDLPQSNQS